MRLAASSSHPPPGPAAPVVPLPPPKARRQPAAPARKQRHGFAAALRNAGLSTLLAAVAAALLPIWGAGAAQGCARLHSRYRRRLRCNLRCRAGMGVWAVGRVMPPASLGRRHQYHCQQQERKQGKRAKQTNLHQQKTL